VNGANPLVTGQYQQPNNGVHCAFVAGDENLPQHFHSRLQTDKRTSEVHGRTQFFNYSVHQPSHPQECRKFENETVFQPSNHHFHYPANHQSQPDFNISYFNHNYINQSNKRQANLSSQNQDQLETSRFKRLVMES